MYGTAGPKVTSRTSGAGPRGKYTEAAQFHPSVIGQSLGYPAEKRAHEQFHRIRLKVRIRFREFENQFRSDHSSLPIQNQAHIEFDGAPKRRECAAPTAFARNGFIHGTKSRRSRASKRRGKLVRRDFAHLAVALCRCMNIPARYCSGYLGDIGVPPVEVAMDFHAWFEVYLDNSWHAYDARHHIPRTGGILMAVGRDAADTALTTAFGWARLTRFDDHTDEMSAVSPRTVSRHTPLLPHDGILELVV
jgi:hypothetical protein